MPQMSPLNWLTLMTTFSSILMMMMIMNFFSFPLNPSMKEKVKLMKKINWKW